jgi:hypothetical protein
VNYLIPVDAEFTTSTHVGDEAMPLDRVLAKVEGAKKLRLVILMPAARIPSPPKWRARA